MYSIHDGPGIRTTVFLKGCPLNCWWCHNPESQEMNANVLVIGSKCIGCGMCVKSCKFGSLAIEDGKIVQDKEKCTNCGECAEACPSEERCLAGKETTVDEVMKEIEKDIIFYEQSNGGVTFSGGEPFAQPGFLKELLKRCKKKNIHVTVDTSGFVNEDILVEASENIDLFLYDIKIMDDTKHIKYTGVSNKIILDNLKKIVEMNKRVFLRIPIIPGINDDEENITKTAEYLASLNGIEQVNVLPYHNISSDKYKRLSWEYKLPDIKDPTQDVMEAICNKFKAYGLKTKIGG